MRTNVLGVRLASGALILLVVGLIGAWALGPVLAALAQAKQDEMLLRRYKELVARGPQLQQAVIELRDELARGDMLFTGSSAELASANLQTDLQSLVAAAGGQIETSEIGTPQNAQGLEQLTISLDISLPGDRLPMLLQAIDAHRPYLFVQGMDIRARDDFDSSRMLDLDMQINGFSDIE